MKRPSCPLVLVLSLLFAVNVFGYGCALTNSSSSRDTSTPSKALIGHWASQQGNSYFDGTRYIGVTENGARTEFEYDVIREDQGLQMLVIGLRRTGTTAYFEKYTYMLSPDFADYGSWKGDNMLDNEAVAIDGSSVAMGVYIDAGLTPEESAPVAVTAIDGQPPISQVVPGGSSSNQSRTNDTKDSERIEECRDNLRTIEAAMTQYYYDKDKYPTSPNQLVPKYIKTRPVEPFGGSYKIETVNGHPRAVCSKGHTLY